MNTSLILALAGFGGVILAAAGLMLFLSGRRPGGSNGGTDVSSWSDKSPPDPPSHGHN